MTEHPKRPRDPNQLAKSIIDIATGRKSHVLTKLSLPSGKSVVVVGVSQGEFLAPSMVGYLDRRLGVKSPWFAV